MPGSRLTADLKSQLALLVDGMRSRLDDGPDRIAARRATYAQAAKDNHTAATWTDYVDDQPIQAVVG